MEGRLKVTCIVFNMWVKLVKLIPCWRIDSYTIRQYANVKIEKVPGKASLTFNQMYILALWPLAQATLKISAHWEGVQQLQNGVQCKGHGYLRDTLNASKYCECKYLKYCQFCLYTTGLTIDYVMTFVWYSDQGQYLSII